MPPSLTQQFSKKLPNAYLYKLAGLTRYGDKPDWFNFLSTIDENRIPIPTRQWAAKDEFHYIRYDANHFAKIVFPIIRANKAKSFLDVGCGGGDKLAMVRKEFRGRVKTYGIEHDPGMACWARLYADSVACTDAMKACYGAFDVIYAYWPICDRELMTKLVVRILDQMHPKATFILLGFRVNSDLHPRAGKIEVGNVW